MTPKQIEIMECLAKNGGKVRVTARELGIGHNYVIRVRDAYELKQAKQGIGHGGDVSHLVPEGFQVKGVSSLVDSITGETRLQWVKTDQDREKIQAAMNAVAESLSESIPRLKPTPKPKSCNASLLNCYVITDYHLGMLAWGEETGADWDTDIAEDMLYRWFESAIKLSPDAETAVFAQLGDFMHWDGIEAVTPTNRHLLDADTRFHRLIRVAIRTIRRVISLLLAKHEKVVILMAEGNHDIVSSMWLSEMFAALYEDEPRITVDTSPDPYYCYEHGETSLFFHHGHKKSFKDIASVFVAKFRDTFGRTKHSYAHMGHLHHNKVEENNLMTVEQHRTLAAPDAHASRGGWISGREAKVITYHSAFGEVSRQVIGVGMVQ